MIETERLLLMPRDLGTIDALLESDEVFFARYGFINDGGEFINPSPDYLHKERQRLIDHPEEYPFAVDYLIVVKEIKTAIGSIDYKRMPDENGVSEIGYGMSPQYEGHGYMTEAVLAMLSFGKENGVKKVVADTLIDNVKSQNVLRRCRFSKTGKEENKFWFARVL